MGFNVTHPDTVNIQKIQDNDPQRMNPDDYGDALTFPLVPDAG